MRSFRTSEQNNAIKVVKDSLSLFCIRLHTDTELGTRSEPWPFSEKRCAPNAKSGHGGSALRRQAEVVLLRGLAQAQRQRRGAPHVAATD